MENWFLYLILGLILLGIIYLKLSLGKNKGIWKKNVRLKLSQITANEKSTNPLEWKALLVEMDKLLDYSFKASGVKGETMGERLKNAKSMYKYSDYQNIWEAHKARNKIAHEYDAKISISDMKKHYLVLKKSVKTLI